MIRSTHKSVPLKRAAGKPAAPPPANGGDSHEGERLSKRVMQIKQCSRREAELYIEGGWVTVDGVVVQEPPFRVSTQAVAVDAAATLMGAHEVTLLLHKPADWLDGMEQEADSRPARARGQNQPRNARALLAADHRWSQDPAPTRTQKRHFTGLLCHTPLETGASGLVVFSQDWRIQRKLGEDMGHMEHELVADVAGEALPEALEPITRALKDPRNPMPATKFSISSSSPERSKLRFAVKGAHPGLVAFLCDKAGLELLALRRIRLGRVALSELPVGHWRYLDAFEKF